MLCKCECGLHKEILVNKFSLRQWTENEKKVVLKQRKYTFDALNKTTISNLKCWRIFVSSYFLCCFFFFLYFLFLCYYCFCRVIDSKICFCGFWFPQKIFYFTFLLFIAIHAKKKKRLQSIVFRCLMQLSPFLSQRCNWAHQV